MYRKRGEMMLKFYAAEAYLDFAVVTSGVANLAARRRESHAG